jgi:hypothetical protein
LSQEEPTPKEESFVCDECGRTFGSEQAFKVHQAMKHKKEKEEATKEEAKEVMISQEAPTIPSKKKPFQVFPELRSPAEIISEILGSYGVSEEFIEWIARYVDRKGGLDPGWLFNMLTTARTGRRFTDSEAWIIVDEVVSELEKERQEAERRRRPWTFTVISTRTGASPYPPPAYTSYPSPYSSSTYSAYYPSGVVPSIYGHTKAEYYPPPQPSLTEDKVREIMREMLEEKRKREEIDEMREKIEKIEKESTEKIVKLKEEFAETLAKMKEDIIAGVKDVLPPKPSEEGGISKKDLDLMRSELEKSYLTKIAEVEDKRREDLIKNLEKELAEIKEKVSKPTTTISPEGWSDDTKRAFTEVGTRALDTLERIAADRKPLEWVFRIIAEAPKKPPPKGKISTDLASLIEEQGGLVE